MGAKTARRCPVVHQVWNRRCVRAEGHRDAHRNDEIPGDTLTWGFAARGRANERGE